MVVFPRLHGDLIWTYLHGNYPSVQPLCQLTLQLCLDSEHSLVAPAILMLTLLVRLKFFRTLQLCLRSANSLVTTAILMLALLVCLTFFLLR
jgi:hypothetical protein